MSRPYWPPFCGAEVTAPDAGLVVCSEDVHPLSERHRDAETGFQWWTHQSYPRSPRVQSKED